MIFKELFAIRKGEWSKALLLAFYFFLVIAVFWILKPIKKTYLVTYYPESKPFLLFGYSLVKSQTEQVAKFLNMLVAGVASVLFAYLSHRFVRQALVVVIHLFFVLTLAAYAGVIENPSEFTVWTFYLYGDLWSVLNVTLFWAFSNDLVTSDEAKRSYGIIGLGGVLGGIVGSSSSGFLLESLGAQKLLFVAVMFNLMIIANALWVGRLARKKTVPDDANKPTADSATSTTEGARLVFGSQYLIAIMGIVALYEMVSTIMDFQFTEGVLAHAKAAGWDKVQIGAFFGKVFSVTNVLALVVQLFLTGLIMRRLGVGVALLVLPVMAFMGSLGYMIVPFIYTAAFLSVVDNSFNYSINQSAKEALYVPTEQRVKYRAKGFIDIFVKQSAKVVGVAFNLIVPGLIAGYGDGVRYLSLASIGLLCVWIYLAVNAGRGFTRLSQATVPATRR